MSISPLPFIRKYLRKKLLGEVYGGPYKGLKFPEQKRMDCYEAKLIGSYEQELTPVIKQLILRKLESLTFLGAAEGYHALGISRLTGLVPTCYESNNELRKQLTQLAKANSLIVKTYASFEATTSLHRPAGLIFIDIEGDEIRILTEDRLENWSSHRLIIEIHGQEILENITKRSEKHFHSEFISCQKRTLKDYPFPVPFRYLLRRWWKVPLQEWRSDSIGWLVLNPLNSASAEPRT